MNKKPLKEDLLEGNSTPLGTQPDKSIKLTPREKKPYTRMEHEEIKGILGNWTTYYDFYYDEKDNLIECNMYD